MKTVVLKSTGGSNPSPAAMGRIADQKLALIGEWGRSSSRAAISDDGIWLSWSGRVPRTCAYGEMADAQR